MYYHAIFTFTPPSPSEVKFLPYISGERTPHNDAFVRGAFAGLDRHTGVGSAQSGGCCVECALYVLHTNPSSALCRGTIGGGHGASGDGGGVLRPEGLPRGHSAHRHEAGQSGSDWRRCCLGVSVI